LLTRKGSQVQTLSRPPTIDAGQAGCSHPACCIRSRTPPPRAANGQQPRENRRPGQLPGRPSREVQAAAQDANEGDTRLLVTDFLCDGLGFDKYADLTTEYQVKGEFADYGLRIDRELVAFIEVKRGRHQALDPPSAPGRDVRRRRRVEWIILTNGSVWQVYHLTGGLPVVIDLALEVDLLGDEPPSHKVNQLFYLSRESLKKRQIDELWKARRATSPASLAQVLVSDNVAEAIRKELWRQTGHRGSTRPRSSGCSATRCFAPAAFKGKGATK
jgi:hypothetical protein